MSNQTTEEVTQISRHIQALLSRQELLQELVHRQKNQPKQALLESLTRRQSQGEIQQLVNRFHPSDIANLLEQLPPSQRQLIWHLIDSRHIGAVLLELSDKLRESLLEALPSDDLIQAASHLDTDEIADLMQVLPDEVVPDLLSSLSPEQSQNVQSTLSFPEDTVGAWMEFEVPIIRDDVTLDTVLRYLRRKGGLPDESGKIMVVDESGLFKGALSVSDLLIKEGDSLVADVMQTDLRLFHTRDSAEEAARDFERYELLVAPVVNSHGRLVGMLRVNSLMDLMDELAQRKFLAQAGLTREENLFDPLFHSARNRWPWIGLNLIIVFIASRVIGQFESTISSMVALAALLPITANIGGNAGNQVVALVIRGLALKQLDRHNLSRLFIKESGVAVINGLMWGSLTGVLTLILYQNLGLAAVIMLAMLMTMILAALIGMSIPLILKRFGQDPVLGSSVITTGLTDTLGFLIFLGLATILIT